MTGAELTFLLTLLVAAGAAVVLIYLAVAGRPGVVGFQPPPGSSKAPVYSFFGAWFISGFAARSSEGIGSGWTVVRLALLVAAVIAMLASWQRLRRNPNPPPRV